MTEKAKEGAIFGMECLACGAALIKGEEEKQEILDDYIEYTTDRFEEGKDSDSFREYLIDRLSPRFTGNTLCQDCSAVEDLYQCGRCNEPILDEKGEEARGRYVWLLKDWLDIGNDLDIPTYKEFLETDYLPDEHLCSYCEHMTGKDD